MYQLQTRHEFQSRLSFVSLFPFIIVGMNIVSATGKIAYFRNAKDKAK